MRVRSRQLVLVLGTVVVLAACGDTGGDGADPATAPTDAGTDGAAASPGIAEGEPHPDASSGAPAGSAGPAEASCSAGDLVVTQMQPSGVEEAAAETYNAIRSAALACDYERLAAQAGEGFTYSFGADGDPASHWAELEARGEEPMARLVQVLGTPVAVDDHGTYVWPAVHARPEDDEAWEAVAGIYPPDQLERWRTGGSGYLGHRVGIDPDGTWRFFVAGD